MPSQIKVDQIAGATGSTVTLPSGQTLDLSSGTVNLPSTSLSTLNATNLTTGTVPNARLSGITADKLDLISTASVPSVTAKGTPSVSDGYIQLNCEQNSHGIKIKSPPHSAGASYTMVMPNAIGTSNQVLKMNSGATALEFGTLASGILQVKSITLTTSVSFSNSSYTNVTGLSLSITPSSASNKILVLSHLVTAAISSGSFGARLARGGTGIGVNTESGSFQKGSFGGLDHGDSPPDATAGGSIVFLDAPSSTSSLTYSIQAISPAGDTMFINRPTANGGSTHEHRGTSSLTLIEIASSILT